ncbi:MAG: bifunctional nuclease family protein [Bacteroidaceae bacterium]|nr:bifunctional nuclease family protein [Bacteroidaceae bacterium]
MVELYVSEILSRASGDRVFIMILHEKDGMRKLPVLIGAFEAQSITFAKRNIHFERPITHDLFKNFAEAYGVTLKCATIYKISEGTFYSHLIFRDEEREMKIDARTSDAVAIAMRFGAPIYIEDELLNTLCIKEEWENAFSIPITLAGTETLREVMERAVKDENYELAMKLKQELDLRTKSNDKHENTPEGINN